MRSGKKYGAFWPCREEVLVGKVVPAQSGTHHDDETAASQPAQAIRAAMDDVRADERRRVGEELLEGVNALTVYDMSEQLFRDTIAVIRRICGLEEE